jgi:hypothetical protein
LLISEKTERMLRRFSKCRGVVSRITAVVFCVATLVDCSASAIPQRHSASSGVTCFANIPHTSSLPLGAHVDCHGQATDAYGRLLSYVGGDIPWRAIDHGVGIDPSRPAASPEEIQSAERDAALSHRGTTRAAVRTSASPSPLDSGSDDGFGDGTLTSVQDTPQGKLRLQLDGYYYDEHGVEWWYDAKDKVWLKTIAEVRSGPRQSAYYPYFVAYDYINGLAPLWWIFGMPFPEGAVPLETLAARFTVRGAVAATEILVDRAFTSIAQDAGPETVLRMADTEGNFTVLFESDIPVEEFKPPFMTGYQVMQFSVTKAMLTGRVAGSRLVRVAVNDEGLNGTSRWLTTLDQITNPDGTLKTGAEIFDRLGLPRVPARYAFVDKLTADSEFLVGVASDMKPYGWGTGGGLQYYLLKGSYTLERSLPLP